MSNSEAAKLYDVIIEEVITESRQDFEDSGIDEATLQDLRKIWREKLTQSGVATFAWNPPEEEVAAQINASASTAIPQSSSNPGTTAASSIPSSLNGYTSEIPNGVNGNGTSNGNTTINNVSQSIVQPQLSYPTIQVPTHDSSNIALQYGNGIQLPQSVQPKRESDNGLVLPRLNQADGNIEFIISDNRIEIEIPKNFPKSHRKQRRQHRSSGKKNQIGQADGADDSSDDINSDLDDSEFDSQNSDEEDGETEGMIMLCLYDKVQRVKNKWKSNLKDGIANINGKDYAFQKATGESEW